MTTYLGTPDMWNTKPPLMIWLMVGSIRIFGISEWALRIPAWAAAIATCCLVYIFCRSATGSRIAAVMGALTLITTHGFVSPHVATTADYDALLMFFTTAMVASGHFILAARERPSGALLAAFCASMAGAVMTKGIAGLLFLPGLLLAALVHGALFRMLADWRTWLAISLPFVSIGLFYVVREIAAPGYMQAMLVNEAGRYATSVEHNGAHFLHYYWNVAGPWKPQLYNSSMRPWIWLAPLGLCGLYSRPTRPAILTLGSVVSVFLLIISSAKSQFDWYVAPAYPLIASIGAISLLATTNLLPMSDRARRLLQKAVLAVVVTTSLTLGWLIIDHNRRQVREASNHAELQPAAFLRTLSSRLEPGDHLRIYGGRHTMQKWPAITIRAEDSAYSPQEHFYAALLRSQGLDATVVSSDYRAQPGDIIMRCDAAQAAYRGKADLLLREGRCSAVRWRGGDGGR